MIKNTEDKIKTHIFNIIFFIIKILSIIINKFDHIDIILINNNINIIQIYII
jgi:hypothetical protein